MEEFCLGDADSSPVSELVRNDSLKFFSVILSLREQA